tara:strand:+ start:5284 stop:5895 length:612 start_codon:yes stop_codon:yes gene_type:complete
MAFWSEKQVEPKRKFRWLLYWSGVPQFVVKSVKKPSYSVTTTPHQFLNYEFNYPGRVQWQDVTITLVDPVLPDSTKSLYKILEKSGYVIPSAYREAAAATISKKGMVEALGTEIKLSQLDADGVNPIETWVIKNPLITSADFDTLDYSSDELLNVTVTIKYDYATIEGRTPTGDYAGSTVWSMNRDSLLSGARGGVPGDDIAT